MPDASGAATASIVREAHRLTHIAHRFGSELAGLVAAVGGDRAQQRRIVHVLLSALEHRLLFAQDAFDHRLLALETTNASRTAALLHPLVGGLVRVDLVQLPPRAFVGSPRGGAAQ